MEKECTEHNLTEKVRNNTFFADRKAPANVSIAATNLEIIPKTRRWLVGRNEVC